MWYNNKGRIHIAIKSFWKVFMYSNQNNGHSQRRPQKRYSPNDNKFERYIPALILLAVAVIFFILGGVVCVGVYKVINPPPAEDTTPVGVVRPEDIIGEQSSSNETASGTSDEVSPIDKLICIDPGHGFGDGGTADSPNMQGKNEAYFNFEFSKMLKEALEAKGFRVILTHDSVKIPDGFDYDSDNIFSASDNFNGNPVSERRDFAMAQNPDYFISIHCDSFSDPSVHGMRIYYPNTNDASSLAIDKLVSRMAVVTAEYSSTTARKFAQEPDASYAVTKNWGAVPAMLVELGFVTNPDDAACLLDAEWNRKVAEAFSKGIEDYFS